MALWPNTLRDPVRATSEGIPLVTPANTVTLPQKVLSLRAGLPVEMGDDDWPTRRTFPTNSTLTVDDPTVARFAFGTPGDDGEAPLLATPLSTGRAVASLTVGDTLYLQPVRVVPLVNGEWEVFVGGSVLLSLAFTPGDPASRDPVIARTEPVGYPVGDDRAGRGDFLVHGVALGETTVWAGEDSIYRDALIRVLPDPVGIKPIPTVVPPPPATYGRGQIVSLVPIQVTGSDVTVTLTGLPPGLSYSAAAGGYAGTVSETAAIQDYQVQGTLNDGYNPPVTFGFTITITAQAVTVDSLFPPYLTFSLDGFRAINRGQPFPAEPRVLVMAADSNPPSLALSGLPSGVTYDAPSFGFLGNIPSSTPLGHREVTATANDGHNTASISATIEISDPVRTTRTGFLPSGRAHVVRGGVRDYEVSVISLGGNCSVTGAPAGAVITHVPRADQTITCRVSGAAPAVDVPTDYPIVFTNARGARRTEVLRSVPSTGANVSLWTVPCVVRINTNDRLGHDHWPTSSFPALTNGMTIIPLRPNEIVHSTASRTVVNLQAHVRGVSRQVGSSPVIIANRGNYYLVPVRVAGQDAETISLRIGQTLAAPSPLGDSREYASDHARLVTVSGNNLTGVSLGQTFLRLANGRDLIVTVAPASAPVTPEPDPDAATPIGNLVASGSDWKEVLTYHNRRTALTFSSAATISGNGVEMRAEPGAPTRRQIRRTGSAGVFPFTITDGDDRYSGTFYSYDFTGSRTTHPFFGASTSQALPYSYTIETSIPASALPITSLNTAVATVSGRVISVLQYGEFAVRLNDGTYAIASVSFNPPATTIDIGDHAGAHITGQSGQDIPLYNFSASGAPRLVLPATASIAPTTLTLVRHPTTGEASLSAPTTAGTTPFTITDPVAGRRYTGTLRNFIGSGVGNFSAGARASFPATVAFPGAITAPRTALTPTVATVSGSNINLLKAGESVFRAGNGVLWVVRAWRS